MQFQFEKIESELTELSDYLSEQKNDVMLASLDKKLSASLTAIFVTLTQLKPKYSPQFTTHDLQEKKEDLITEIAYVCQQCKEFCAANQFIATKILKIEAYLSSGSTVEKNNASL